MDTKKRSPIPLPPFIPGGGDFNHLNWLKRLKQENRIRKIGPRLYTSLPFAEKSEEMKKAVRAHWSLIVSSLFPKALLSHLTALDYGPNADGEIFVTGSTNRKVKYPGLTLVFLRGLKALPDDLVFLQMKASCRGRAFLEILKQSAVEKRADTLRIIESRLEDILAREGEARLNEIRDQARKASLKLKSKKEFIEIDRIIGALLGTRNSNLLQTQSGKARAQKRPYDSASLGRIELLFAELRKNPLINRPDLFKGKNHIKHKAFFEAYFSNYIEGTTFGIEEAESILFDKKIPSMRPKDAHDILGTYRLVSDPSEMKKVPKNGEVLLSLLKSRHSTLLEYRPEAEPGRFKEKPNRAGDTQFVSPDRVEGTLLQGLEFRANLSDGLSRAIFMMFLIAEVHPFVDGNGRIARIFMNSELFAEGLGTIIIPNVYREDYLSPLRALSRRERAEPLVKSLNQAQAFSLLDFNDYPKILKELDGKNWFRDSEDSKLIR